MIWWIIPLAMIILVAVLWVAHQAIIKYPAIELIILSELHQHGKLRGIVLQKRIAEQGYRLDDAAFYGMMARLEDAQLVRGWYELKTIAEQIIKERWFKITDRGEQQKNETERNLLETYARGIRGLVPIRVSH